MFSSGTCTSYVFNGLDIIIYLERLILAAMCFPMLNSLLLIPTLRENKGNDYFGDNSATPPKACALPEKANSKSSSTITL